MKKNFLTGVLLTLFTLLAYGQEQKEQKFVFSLQAGYGNQLFSSKLLTTNTDAYRQRVRDGLAWNASFMFNPIREAGIGVLYAGQSTKGGNDEGKEHLVTNYIAGQLGGNFFVLPKTSLSLYGGIGYFSFRNNSEVFGKSRTVKMKGKAGLHLGTKLEYRLSAHWGVGVDALLIIADLDEADIDYHDKTYLVLQNNYLRPFSVTGGIQYHF